MQNITINQKLLLPLLKSFQCNNGCLGLRDSHIGAKSRYWKISHALKAIMSKNIEFITSASSLASNMGPFIHNMANSGAPPYNKNVPI